VFGQICQQRSLLEILRFPGRRRSIYTHVPENPWVLHDSDSFTGVDAIHDGRRTASKNPVSAGLCQRDNGASIQFSKPVETCYTRYVTPPVRLRGTLHRLVQFSRCFRNSLKRNCLNTLGALQLHDSCAAWIHCWHHSVNSSSHSVNGTLHKLRRTNVIEVNHWAKVANKIANINVQSRTLYAS